MREITFMEATREVLAKAMERDPTIFVVGESIGAPGGDRDHRGGQEAEGVGFHVEACPESAYHTAPACQPTIDPIEHQNQGGDAKHIDQRAEKLMQKDQQQTRWLGFG